ncbi:complex I subunit 5 family protein [Chthonobacter rhizosphaerae]|uniref:complex I subunit 5 family protein n=1 Tax=Chthonobacter rhizosphaerae TaxID=2735553 RepID=UPI0015EEDD51|nr:proton-conducting transporter membrane subunit [Chthonobacter rhizosphaerae]
MMAGAPLFLILLPLIPAIISFSLPERLAVWRNAVNLLFALVKVGIVADLLRQVRGGVDLEWRYTFLPGHDFLLRVDTLALLFVSLSVFLWLITTVYAIAYFGRGPNLSRFFGFFNLCVLSATGVALSGTAITFFLFYELLTLATWPLVVHNGDEKSLRAGRIYLAYTLAGSAAFLVGILWLKTLVGSVEFTAPPDLSAVPPLTLTLIFVLCVGGLGVKAALVPLHAWLPAAMAAPAPVSALLHAVAVVKAGAFGIVRMIYDVYGIGTVAELGLGTPLAALASVTILYGSLRAVMQADIKKRLAYSTVSQVSYILLGASLIGPFAVIGGLVHLVHQGIMKITLFMCAGALSNRLGIKAVADLDGAGRLMPVTMGAFTIGALGMIGVPPVAGFISKWYLGIGGLQSGAPWVVAVMAGSSLLNAAYFLPMLYRAWLLPPPERAGFRELGTSRDRMLILPAVVTAAAALAAGVFASSAVSPLTWAKLIAERGYLE